MAGHIKQRLANMPETSSDGIMLLLRALQKHVVTVDPNRADRFKMELAEVEKQFRGEDIGQTVKVTTGVLEEYARQTNQMIAHQQSEFMTLVSELTNVLALLPEDQTAFERWNALETQIKAATPADLPKIMAEVKNGLDLSRKEAMEQKQKISDLVSGIISRIRSSNERLQKASPSRDEPLYSPDPVTGLSGRAYAEAELSKTYVQSPSCHLAFFVVKRLNLINRKFGFQRGDEVLLKVVQHLAQSLPDFNNLFRWTPCSFLTIAAPAMSADEVRRKVQAIDLQRVTVILEWEGHSALVPVSLDCRMMALREHSSPELLYQALDSLALDL